MKDRTVKRIVGAVSVAFALWSAMFVTDYYRCGKLEKPVFALRSRDDGETEVYRGAGYCIEVERDAEKNVVSAEMIMFGRIISASIT